jgi:DNA-binding NtrC family response regulator
MLPANSAAKKQTTVLVVDDEAGLRDMLVFGLTDRGYCVSVAANGQEGIEKMQHEPFDLAIGGNGDAVAPVGQTENQHVS